MIHRNLSAPRRALVGPLWFAILCLILSAACTPEASKDGADKAKEASAKATPSKKDKGSDKKDDKGSTPPQADPSPEKTPPTEAKPKADPGDTPKPGDKPTEGSESKPTEGGAAVTANPAEGQVAEGQPTEEKPAPKAVEVAPEPPKMMDVMAGHGPLDDKAREIFWGAAEDIAANHLDAIKEEHENKHFLYSDELNQHLYYKHIKDLGGGYAGVGTDQSYLFIGWQKAHVAWLSDYDVWVKWLHFAYLAFFQEAETFEEFMEYWKDDNAKATSAFLKKYYAERDDARMIAKVYREARGKVYYRMLKLRRKLKEEGIPGFPNSPEQYTFIRELIKAGRVRPYLGNLLDKQGMISIGAASKELNVPMRVLYLSNAENYWRYSEQYKKNMLAQFFDEKSLVIRTSASKPRNGDYSYSAQPGLNFHAWLREDYVRRIRDIIPYVGVRDENDVPFTMFNKPPFNRNEKKKKKKR